METQVLTNLNLEERLETLNQKIQNGQVLEAFEQFYAQNVTMQENENEPTIGKANNLVNEHAFVNGITEFRKAEVLRTIVSDNLTVTEWHFDFTHSDWGVRNYKQISVQRWNDEGQIINEKFYYNN